MQKTLFVVAVASVMLLAPTQALPTDNRDAALLGADRLVNDLQFDDGSFPWIVGQSGKHQNVQGNTAWGLLEAYKLSLDPTYLGNETTGAEGNRNWLADYMADNPTAFISSANVFYLAEYAVINGSLSDLDLARDAMDRAVQRFGSGTALVEGLTQIRLNQGHTNMGLWDAALFVRAANDIGNTSLAKEMADALATQTIVDPFNTTNNWYELGLAGLLFGLAEADAAAHGATLVAARDALLATQCSDGSFPATWQGIVYCSEIQSTAYAVVGLSMALDQASIQSACDFVAGAQSPDGGWDLGGYEIAAVDSEAVVALVHCVAPTNNAATSPADAVRSIL